MRAPALCLPPHPMKAYQAFILNRVGARATEIHRVLRDRKNFVTILCNSIGTPRSDPSFAGQRPRFNGALTFDFDGAARLKRIAALEVVYHTARDLNGIWQPVRFHAARQIYSITPEIVDEFSSPYDARDDRTPVDPDAQPNRRAAVLAKLACNHNHLLRHCDHAFCVVRTGLR